MIRLRTLGAIGLVDASDTELASILRQPKRLALLAYLALARPRGFHRRDSLLALFWPELDDERGRGALRQALYTLRRQLPDGVLSNRGDGEIGVDPAHVWADVHAFEAEVAAGRPEAALELYRGELLPGFHVPDAAPELGYWIDEERSRLHAMALTAARDAATAAESRGDLPAAVRWAARATELAPLDEEVARREMELLHRTGDRAGALRAFEQWARRLGEELDLAPSPATLDLVEGLRRAPAARTAPRSRSRPVSAGTPSPGTESAGTESAGAAAPGAVDRGAGGSPGAVEQSAVAATPRRIPAPEGRRRRVRPVALAVVATVVLAGLTLLLPVRVDWSDGEAATAAARVMVVPFAYRGDGDAAYLSEGLVYLFSVALDGDQLRAVDPNGVVRRTAEAGLPEYDPESAAALADRTGAGYFVLGNVVEADGHLQLSASLYEQGAAAPIARASASGETGRVLDLVDQVAAELLTARSGAPSRVTRLAAVTTGSLPALKAYLTGERLLREGRFAEAIEAFETATLADSLFALAHYRTSQAASWAFRGELATRAASLAVRYADRLPEHERRLLAAHETYRRGEAPRALQALRELGTLYPDDPDVWYRLGEVRMHFGPLFGWSIADAREPFVRAIELDRSYTDAYYHLAQIAAARGDTAEAIGYARLAVEAAPNGARAPQMRTLDALLGGGENWDARVKRLEPASDFTVVSAAYNVAVFGGRPDRARDIARKLVAPSRPAHTRAFGHLLLAELELALGRWSEARRHLEALEELDHRDAAEYRALLAMAPGARASIQELEGLLEQLRDDDGGLAPGTAALPWKPEDRYAPVPRLYARGLVAARLGLTAEVDAVLAAFSALPPELASIGDLATDVRLLRAGGADELEAVGATPSFGVPAEEAVLSQLFSRPARRYHQARRLEEQGQPREALQWYESLAVFSIHDLPWGVPALLDRARIHESLGEVDAAATLYRQFARLWADADDPELRNLALSRLGALEARVARR